MPTRQRKWLYPVALEREYAALLVAWAVEVNDSVRISVESALPWMRLDDIESIPESAGWQEAVRRMFLQAAGALSAAGMISRVLDFSRQAAEFNKRQFHAVMRSFYRVDIFVAEPWLADVLKAWESANIGLIKSIPAQALEKMHGQMIAALRRGATRKEVSEMLREQYGATKKRARLIARDQIGKLNGQLTQERQTGIGVRSYIWRGMLDERERDSHVDREGERFDWDNPPPDGAPGEPILCRCSAQAVLPLLDDLQGVQFSNLTPRRGFTLTGAANGIR